MRRFLLPASHSLNRRSFLVGAASLTLSSLLTGCGGQSRSALNLRLLKGSVPPQILNEFRKLLKQNSSLSSAVLNFTPEPQLATLFSLLQTWKQESQKSSQSPLSSWLPFLSNRQSNVSDLVMLGDYWLEKAIQQGLIQPLNPTQFQGLNQLPEKPDWRSLVTRNKQGQLDPKGQIWGLPYLWGSTVIAYRQDIFREKGLPFPTDWSDLWRSDLRRHISLLDQAREVIGLTLKKLGKSYNTTNLDAVPTLKSELDALQQQVKLYSSDSYLQPLLLGDTWLAVGWSTDILPIMQRSKDIRVVMPKSGTALWANLWVRPASNQGEVSDLLKEWIRFCWQPDIASRLSLLSRATSPALSAAAPATLPPELQTNSVLLPGSDILQNSEFLLPLPASTIEQYASIWKNLRQTG